MGVNWLTNFVRPRIQALIHKSQVPDHLWVKCLGCDHMLFHRDLEANLQVCHHCSYHFRIDAPKRLSLIFDDGSYTEHVVKKKVAQDPLKFKDVKRYSDRLKEYRAKIGRDDSVIVAYGRIQSMQTVAVMFDFKFMGGSMGMAAGEAFLEGVDLAVSTGSALLAITASGGARMQEGMLSLMQMPRTIIGVQKLRHASLPYICLLTDPTTGGVSASFALLGDVNIAEPGAIIGFAGARVIEETIRQKLPDGFQKSEYLLDHGMIDCVVPRRLLRLKIGTILRLLMKEDLVSTSQA